jgi:hypothetical protein
MLIDGEKQVNETEIDYKGESVFAMGKIIQADDNPNNNTLFVSYYPKSPYEQQITELQKEVEKIFIGIMAATFSLYIVLALLYLFIANYQMEKN